jgi:hypothetical protein
MVVLLHSLFLYLSGTATTFKQLLYTKTKRIVLLTAVKMSIVGFWVVTPRGAAGGLPTFRRNVPPPSSDPVNVGSTFL